MLILTRKSGESIKVGDTVKITILEIKGNHVKIGIDAPKDLEIYREEIYDTIKSHNVMAAIQTPDRLDQVHSLWQKRKKEHEDGV